MMHQYSYVQIGLIPTGYHSDFFNSFVRTAIHCLLDFVCLAMCCHMLQIDECLMHTSIKYCTVLIMLSVAQN